MKINENTNKGEQYITENGDIYVDKRNQDNRVTYLSDVADKKISFPVIVTVIMELTAFIINIAQISKWVKGYKGFLNGNNAPISGGDALIFMGSFLVLVVIMLFQWELRNQGFYKTVRKDGMFYNKFKPTKCPYCGKKRKFHKNPDGTWLVTCPHNHNIEFDSSK